MSWLSLLGFNNVYAEEVLVWSADRGPDQQRPALFLNGTFSLDIAPLNMFGANGAVDFELFLYPWYGSQPELLGAGLSPSPLNVRLFLNYPTSISFGDGITLTNVEFQIIAKPQLREAPALFYLEADWELDVPVQDEPLLLEASVAMTEGSSAMRLEASLADWQNAFGIDGLWMDLFRISADVGVPSPRLQIETYWLLPGFALNMAGVFSKEFIGVATEVYGLSMKEINTMFRAIAKVDLAPSDFNLYFHRAFIGIANAPGTVLGQSVVRGVTVQATMDVWEFRNLDVLLQIGSDGVLLAAEINNLPAAMLPDEIQVDQLWLKIDIPSRRAATRSTSLGLYLNATFLSVRVESIFYIATKPTVTAFVGKVTDVSLSSVLPFIPSEFDMQIDLLAIAYFAQGKMPPLPQIRESFPFLQQVPMPKQAKPSPVFVIAAELQQLAFLELFGINNNDVKIFLFSFISKALKIITVKINAPTLRMGSLEGGDLALMISKKGISTRATFSLNLYLQLPGAPDVAQLQTSVSISKTTFHLVAILGLPDASNPNPVWPNAFGLPGFDVYYLGLGGGFNIQTGLPSQLLASAKFGFTSKASGTRYIAGGRAIIGGDPTNQLLQVELRHPSWCIVLAAAEPLLGDAFRDLGFIEQLCLSLKFIRLEYFSLYVSNGAWFGDDYFPPGGQLSATARIFNVRASLSGAISIADAKLTMAASLPPFSIGPLAVTGMEEQNSTGSFTLTPTSQQFEVDAALTLFGTKVGLYVDVTPRSFAFEFAFPVVVLEIEFGAHAELPIPMMPPLSPQLATQAIFDPESALTTLTSFDPVSLDFGVTASVDLSDFGDFIVDILKECIPNLDELFGVAADTFNDAVDLGKQAVAEVEDGLLAVQDEAMELFSQADQLTEQFDSMKDEAEEAAKEAWQGVQDAARDAEALVNDARDTALAAVGAAEEFYGQTVAMADEMVGFAEDAVNAALEAVADFANKVASGFFRAFDIFENQHHRSMHIMRYQQLYHEYMRQKQEEYLQPYLQSRSPHQSLPVPTSRKLQSIFSVVYDGIAGAIDFIREQLDKAVDAAKDTLNEVKEQTTSMVDAALPLIQQAKDAVGPAIKAAEDAGNAIKETAETVAKQADAAVENLEAVRDAAVEAANQASNAVNTAVNAVENVADQVGDAVETATDTLGSAIGDASKWMSALKDGVENFIEIETLDFKSDWKELVSTGDVDFVFKASFINGAFDVDERVTFTINPQAVEKFFVSKIKLIIQNLPGLQICKLF